MDQQLFLFPIEAGVTVRVDGLRGTFTVVGHNGDGSVQVYGGAKQQYRSFPSNRVRAVKTPMSKREQTLELHARLRETQT